MLILEVHPLLHAEKWAVSYPSSTLAVVLRQAGLASVEESFPIRNCTAYVLSAARKDRAVSVDVQALRSALHDAWDERLDNAVEEYAARQTITDFSAYCQHLQRMTTIASILGHRRGYWK